ncbi:MAG TPA: hypothetical protein VLH08_17915 [Acidobacteriota bacterium]|jgi:phage protein D|nr:hypothetical protein [Acidobacteriota bacterium]
MALEIISKQTSDFYAPRFDVEIQDKELPLNISKSIMSVTIDEKLDEGVGFKFTMRDQFDLGSQKFQWLDNELFREGNTVTVKMGYSNQLEIMASGKIKTLESSFFSGESITLTIEGEDFSYDMLKRKSDERAFIDQTYSEIAKTIASEAKLTLKVDETGKFERIVRKNSDKTYFAFLQDLAKKADREFFVRGKTMYFVEPRNDEKEVVTLELGKDIINFKPRISTKESVTEVEVRGHNTANPSQPIIGRAVAGSERAQEAGKKTASQIAQEQYGAEGKKVITNVVVNSVEEANTIAKSVLNQASSKLIEGDGECIGLLQIRPGVNIRLEKMGERFSGKYYVNSVTHTIDSSGYRTRFSVKRNAV